MMRYKCESCGKVHVGVLDSCPKCGVRFESLLDKVTPDKTGFLQIKKLIVERLSDELMVGEDAESLTMSFPYYDQKKLATDYARALELVGGYVDPADAEFLDRCLYKAEWVLDYAVLHFAFAGLNSLGEGTVSERLNRALGFDDEIS